MTIRDIFGFEQKRKFIFLPFKVVEIPWLSIEKGFICWRKGVPRIGSCFRSFIRTNVVVKQLPWLQIWTLGNLYLTFSLREFAVVIFWEVGTKYFVGIKPSLIQFMSALESIRPLSFNSNSLILRENWEYHFWLSSLLMCSKEFSLREGFSRFYISRTWVELSPIRRWSNSFSSSSSLSKWLVFVWE